MHQAGKPDLLIRCKAPSRSLKKDHAPGGTESRSTSGSLKKRSGPLGRGRGARCRGHSPGVAPPPGRGPIRTAPAPPPAPLDSPPRAGLVPAAARPCGVCPAGGMGEVGELIVKLATQVPQRSKDDR